MAQDTGELIVAAPLHLAVNDGDVRPIEGGNRWYAGSEIGKYLDLTHYADDQQDGVCTSVNVGPSYVSQRAREQRGARDVARLASRRNHAMSMLHPLHRTRRDANSFQQPGRVSSGLLLLWVSQGRRNDTLGQRAFRRRDARWSGHLMPQTIDTFGGLSVLSAPVCCPEEPSRRTYA
jgi:hypothetical protein